MVLGCTSNAGKSLLVTALCRWFVRQGVDAVRFKAQNMSNNARVVDGGEIGVAQWLQAGAARVRPDVRMNPVLLKPEADTRSQVVVNGVVRRDVTEMPWRDRGPSLWPAMAEAFDNGRLTAPGTVHDHPEVCAAGSVLATTVHGLLEDPDVLAALFGRRPLRTLDDTFEQLADAVDTCLDTDLLRSLARDR